MFISIPRSTRIQKNTRHKVYKHQHTAILLWCEVCVTDAFKNHLLFWYSCNSRRRIVLYLTVSIIEPVKPVQEGRADPGQGPKEGPVSQWFWRVEISESVWEGLAVPGVLNGNIHGESWKTYRSEESLWLRDGAVFSCIAFIRKPIQPTSHAHLHQGLCQLVDLSGTMMSCCSPSLFCLSNWEQFSVSPSSSCVPSVMMWLWTGILLMPSELIL